MNSIQKIEAFEVLNGRGRPTVEVELTLDNGLIATASAPTGTSKGSHEATERYDGGARYCGKGVRCAVEAVNERIAPCLAGMDPTDQRGIDRAMRTLDGTEDKSALGANAILPVSVAVCKAGAMACGLPLYRYIGGMGALRVPNPIGTVISGGAFSLSGLEFEDYILICDRKELSVEDGVHMIWMVRTKLEERLRKQYGAFPDTTGALAPPLKSTREAFDAMHAVISQNGFEKYITLGLDVAANELFDAETGLYTLGDGQKLDAEALLAYYERLAAEYPLTYLEDGFSENDFASFAALKRALPKLEIVGDDLFATNVQRLSRGIREDSVNAVLIKINQIGTITEAVEACVMGRSAGYDAIVSLRSSDTVDPFIADFATGMGARQIKLGSPVRGERNAKFNRLMRIDHDLKK